MRGRGVWSMQAEHDKIELITRFFFSSTGAYMKFGCFISEAF